MDENKVFGYDEEMDSDWELDEFNQFYWEDAKMNMPCDNTGYCNPSHCPQFHECQGLHH